MHIPVLQKEVIKYLNPEPNKNFIDATVGEGGHSLEIIEKIKPKGKILGIEWDKEVADRLKSKIREMKLENRFIVVWGNFVDLAGIVKQYKFLADGVLFDLGFLSWHVEESKRGFSFRKNEELDMRYNPQENLLKAKDIINKFSFQKILGIIKEYGEEKFARRITEAIIRERQKKPIETTFQLVEIIKKATPAWYHRKKIHFATRTFQALRIATNSELENIKEALPQALKVMRSGGRLVVISFHSLEDRIVKEFFKKQAKEGSLKILTKKPQRPTSEEINFNPRSRSAKLRAAQKL
ncbi:16S rRNA (cytosine(1402)-N(4))-methyltransferase RsmH [bacterium]|nr:16S rRNA (cytosine(1402)-N(4))-methyltransferase RsmH [bacterium]